jgi:hypothetical protein
MNELAGAKIDEFAKSNPQLTQSTPDRLSKFGMGTPVALRHPQTGEITPMVNIEGRYHHPSTFTRIAGHTDEYLPTTTGISTEMGHEKYGKPIIQPGLDETESDKLEAQAQATIDRVRNQRFRMRTEGSPMVGRRFPGFGTVSGTPVGDPAGQARYLEEASKTPEYKDYQAKFAADQQRLKENNFAPVTSNGSGERFGKTKFVSEEEVQRRNEVTSGNLALMHEIPRRNGEAASDHIARVKSLVSQAQSKAGADYEAKRKADYFDKFGRELPQSTSSPLGAATGENSAAVAGRMGTPVLDYGTINNPGPDAPKGVPAKAPTKTLKIDGVSYMHPEDFQSRKAAGLKVPNYKLSSGGASYVMEKTAVFNPKLDDEGKHIHNDEGVPQYTKSYTSAPKDYSKKAEVKLKMVKGYKRPLSESEYNFVQANIKKIQKKTKSNKLDPETRAAFDNDARAAARDAAERAAAKARRESFEAAFNK